MKPNLVVVQPSHIEMDSLIEHFCEVFCDTHYVYLVRPHSEWREDSPSGLRFLNHTLDRLPRFGRVDTAIAVADRGVADRLRESYPECRLAVWDPCNAGQLHYLIDTLLKVKWSRERSEKVGPAIKGWGGDSASASASPGRHGIEQKEVLPAAVPPTRSYSFATRATFSR